MLISEFSRRTGLARETIRFYVRLKLFRPHTTSKGGRNPYLMFTEQDVQTAEVIRIGQALGLSLQELSQLREARRQGKMQRPQRIALMNEQLARLETKASELKKLKAYVRAKIAWLECGEVGPEPRLTKGAA